MTSKTEGDIALTEAEEGDLVWIIETEKGAVKEGFVSGDPEVRHRLQMNDRACLYLVVRKAGEPVGYIILRGVMGAEPVVELKRIVITKRDAGLGQTVMQLLIAFVFDDLKAHRLWLDVIDDNRRAQHVYRKLGFVEEGRFREAALRKDGWRDLVVFGMLARDRET
jgi:RimJ/RimL family protein N-acetyltransferase